MKKVIVTGVNGFIGSHIAQRFVHEGVEVHGLVRKSSNLDLLEGIDVTLHYGDITDPATIDNAMKGQAFDAVVHNAGFASDWGPTATFMKINFEGAQNVAKAAKSNHIKRIVHISSTAIHGFGSETALDENSPIVEKYDYAISKWRAEDWIHRFGREHHIETTAIRPGNVYGTRDHTFIDKYLDLLDKGNGAYINKGSSLTCPTYVENLSHAISLAAFHPNAVQESFIITDGLEITWKEFTEKLCEAMQVKKPTFSVPFAVGNTVAGLMENTYKLLNTKNAPLLTKYRMENGGKHYHFSIEKAKKLLGFEPHVDLDEAIKRTVTWYRNR